MTWISNAVVVLLVVGGVAIGFAISGNPLWREAAVSLGRRRPIALLCVALFVVVGLLDSVRWASGRGEGTPSLDAAASSYDLTALVNGARHMATVVLMLSYYTKLMFGDARIPSAEITYRDGDVMIDGKSRGAGLMVVTGDLVIAGQFRFDGVIVVLGSLINSGGTADIYGAVIQRPGSAKLRLEGNVNIQYSAEALKIAADTLGTSYVAFNGWQELSRN